MDDLNFFNQKKKKKKTKKIFDIDEAEEGVKVCLQNLTMAENSYFHFLEIGSAGVVSSLSLCLGAVHN